MRFALAAAPVDDFVMFAGMPIEAVVSLFVPPETLPQLMLNGRDLIESQPVSVVFSALSFTITLR